MKDLSGQIFGRLTVISYHHSNKKRLSYWLCKCECGNEKVIRSSNLTSGATKSCGCLHREISKEVCHKNFAQHCGSGTKLHSIWLGMIKRCYDVKEKAYKNYGARGITICSEWRDDFILFKDWAENNGYKDGLSLDRINNNGSYSPENCRWATKKEQANNRRTNKLFKYNGHTKTLKQWCEKFGVKYKLAWERIFRYGKSFENALELYPFIEARAEINQLGK